MKVQGFGMGLLKLNNLAHAIYSNRSYELLDEMMDYRYPQYIKVNILYEFIKVDAYRMEVTQHPPMVVTNVISWRSEGLSFTHNQYVFLDVIETINILVNSNRHIIRSEVVGALKMKTCLSGMAECKLSLNNRVLLESQGGTSKEKSIDFDDIKFHQCTHCDRFENDGTIRFIPPHGSFVIIGRLQQPKKLIIQRSKLNESTAADVRIELPIPSDVTLHNIHTSKGSAKYAPERDDLVWRIRYLPGNKEYILRAEIKLPSVISEYVGPGRKAMFHVKFEMPGFMASGL